MLLYRLRSVKGVGVSNYGSEFAGYRAQDAAGRRCDLVLSSSTADKKLSYRRETARCFVSLTILLTHSRSLKVIRNDTVE